MKQEENQGKEEGEGHGFEEKGRESRDNLRNLDFLVNPWLLLML